MSGPDDRQHLDLIAGAAVDEVLVYLRDADAWVGNIADYAFYDPRFAAAMRAYLRQDPGQQHRRRGVYLVSALQLRTLLAAWPGDTATRLYRKLLTMRDDETLLVACTAGS